MTSPPSAATRAEPQYVAETLAWCNRQRVKRGLRPLKNMPKGQRDDPRSCPCGAATGLKVYEAYAHDAEENLVRTPPSVQRFVAAFDAGRLPQYEAKS